MCLSCFDCQNFLWDIFQEFPDKWDFNLENMRNEPAYQFADQWNGLFRSGDVHVGHRVDALVEGVHRRVRVVLENAAL
jgi:hypothetical protein